MIPLPPAGYEQTVEAIAACGVPKGNIRIAYADELQSDVVTISDLGEVSEVKFQCLHQAIRPFYTVFIEAADQRVAYYSFVDREDRKRARTEAIVWLRSREMLDLVPRFDPEEGLERFAMAIEAVCSIRSGSALKALGSTTLTFRRGFLDGALDNDMDMLTCLRHVYSASNADENGVRLGFVGNAPLGDSE